MIDLQNEIINSQNEILRLSQIKFESGKTSIDDVIEQEKLLKNLQEELNTLKKDRALIEENLIYILSDDNIKSIPNTFATIVPNPDFPCEIPSDIIESRPDYIMS